MPGRTRAKTNMAGEPRGKRRYAKSAGRKREEKLPPLTEEDYGPDDKVKPDTRKARRGTRSRIEIPIDQFEKLCEIQCSQVEIADFFGVCEKTIRNRIDKDEEYGEAWKRGMAKGRISIRRAQMRAVQDPQSKGHATMLVWLGKIFLQQRDSQDLNISNQQEAAKGPYQHPFVTEEEAASAEVTDGDASSLH